MNIYWYCSNQHNAYKKISKTSRAYEIFLKGKTPVDVAFELDIAFQDRRKYWTEFFRLQKMDEFYHLYTDNEYHLDYEFKIYYFLLWNKIDFRKLILKICLNFYDNVKDTILD